MSKTIVMPALELEVWVEKFAHDGAYLGNECATVMDAHSPEECHGLFVAALGRKGPVFTWGDGYVFDGVLHNKHIEGRIGLCRHAQTPHGRAYVYVVLSADAHANKSKRFLFESWLTMSTRSVIQIIGDN